jgi:hypothetical protein
MGFSRVLKPFRVVWGWNEHMYAMWIALQILRALWNLIPLPIPPRRRRK